MLGARKKNQRLAIGYLRKVPMQETLHRVFTHSLYMFRRDKSNLKLLPDLVFSGEWQHSPGKIGDEKKERKLIDRSPLFSSAVST